MKIRFNEKLSEGMLFNKDLESFEFDFENGTDDSIIKLTKDIVYSDAHNPCTYFGYKFEDNIDSTIKNNAINYLKHSNDIHNLKALVAKSVGTLDRIVNLNAFKTIVIPEFSSKLNELIVDEIYTTAFGNLVTYKLIKELPKNIEFDYESYVEYLKSKNVCDKDIQLSCASVKRMLDKIHQLENFKIGQHSKVNYRKYIKNFYKFQTKKDEYAFKSISNNKILIIDDISTTHTTIKYLINVIKNLNPTCEIVVFCLVGNFKH